MGRVTGPAHVLPDLAEPTIHAPTIRAIARFAVPEPVLRRYPAWAMTILVDQAIWLWRGRRWAHLVSDASYEELHIFAGRLGIPRHGFQGDHYDIPDYLHPTAIAEGAVLVDCRILARRLRAAGLRQDNRAGESNRPPARSRTP